MKRRLFLRQSFLVSLGLAGASPLGQGADADRPGSRSRPHAPDDWLERWERNILQASQTRYCDTELGEEIGWKLSPFLNGFHHGYEATQEVRWVSLLVDWAGAWIRRAVEEPDGYLGWPKQGSGGAAAAPFLADSLLGEAMGLRPLLLMAGLIRKRPSLRERFGSEADAWITLAERTFEKWDARGCWRAVGDGGVWVVPPFGIDPETKVWTGGYAHRTTQGFTNPANKQNHIARWLLALHDVTGKPIYRERAERWFRVMRARMRTRDGDRYFVWNYWDPAGPWDYDAKGAPRHWVGVHPNGGYYGIDVEGIVTAWEHGLVFGREDIDRLVATNRDFMWNRKVEGARFQRIDGGAPDARWQRSPGVLWTALIPYDATLETIFLANHRPDAWGGLSTTPWYLAHAARLPAASR